MEDKHLLQLVGAISLFTTKQGGEATSFSAAGPRTTSSLPAVQVCALYLQLAVQVCPTVCPLFTTEGTLQPWSGVSLCIKDRQASAILLAVSRTLSQ